MDIKTARRIREKHSFVKGLSRALCMDQCESWIENVRYKYHLFEDGATYDEYIVITYAGSQQQKLLVTGYNEIAIFKAIASAI